jgi:hypothetical protein
VPADVADNSFREHKLRVGDIVPERKLIEDKGFLNPRHATNTSERNC